MKNAMYDLGWAFAELLYRDLRDGKLKIAEKEIHEKKQDDSGSVDFRDGARLPDLALATGGTTCRTNQG